MEDENIFIDLAEADPQFDTTDGYEQEDIQFFHPSSNPAEAFKKEMHHSIKLSALQKIYDTRDKTAALELLTKSYTYSKDKASFKNGAHNEVVIMPKSCYLDSLVVVPMGLGLDALLPTRQPSPGFGWDLGLKNPYRQFNGKFTHLGFSPTNAVLWFGRCDDQDVWLGLRPHPDSMPMSDRPEKSTTHMPTTLYHLMLLMMGHMCALGGIQDIYQEEGHPESLDSIKDLEDRGNLLQCVPFYLLSWHATDFDYSKDGSYRLDHNMMLILHRLLVDSYGTWEASLPMPWRTLLNDRTPIFFTSRWGQNWRFPLMYSPKDDDLCTAWIGDRNLAKIRFISLALATHLRCVHRMSSNEFHCTYMDNSATICKLEDLDPMENVERYYPGPYWRHWDPENRGDSEDSLEDIPLSEDGVPVHLYDGDGFQVLRQVTDNPEHGVLVRLERIGEIFDGFETDDNLYTNPRTVVSVYPQAYTNLGHFQSTRPPAGFTPILQQINETVAPLRSRRHRSHSGSSSRSHSPAESLSDDDDDYHQSRYGYAVRGISCQGYNAVYHRIRYRQSTHDVQLGQVTGSAAGAFATKPKDKRKEVILCTTLARSMPFDRLERKLETPTLVRELRLENGIVINLELVNDENRTSEYVLTVSVAPQPINNISQEISILR